jgi:2-succinyl-5-enolpyruvyl-6-hydroxy-3-cyclohexene-1-carboxylate synthase
VANLLPAVVEASLARVPLLLLTADRPAELHDRGAPQTIGQAGIFGGFVRWFVQMPLLDGEAATRCHVQSVIGRAVATARGRPAGPVHLNFPFREPLVPTGTLGPAEPAEAESRPFTGAVAGRAQLAPADLDGLAGRITAVPRGLIVAGPADDPELPAALASLADASGYPIVADPLSGLRAGPHDRSHVLVHGDHLVRPGPWRDAHRPDLVIRFGATPTSKPLLTLLTEASPPQIVVDGDGGWIEPAIIPTTFVHADAASTAREVAQRIRTPASGWSADWCEADRRAGRALRDWLAALESRGEPFEGLPFVVLSQSLPDGAMLWAGNSMPVRDLDDWFAGSDRSIRVLSNRGANGIDGVVSTALGAAAAGAGPVTLVVGDVSFIHDLNALVASRMHGLSATIVLIDNDGCGIFSFLPQARLPEHYEELFGTPHGIDVGPIVTALGGECRVVDAAGLRSALADPAAPARVRVLHFRTERARNVEHHREAAAAVAAALARP